MLPGGNLAGLAASCLLLHRDGVPKRRLVVRSAALLLWINAVCVAVTGVAGALLLSGLTAGPHDLLRAGIPILVSGAIAGVVLAIPSAVGRSGSHAPAWIAPSRAPPPQRPSRCRPGDPSSTESHGTREGATLIRVRLGRTAGWTITAWEETCPTSGKAAVRLGALTWNVSATATVATATPVITAPSPQELPLPASGGNESRWDG